MDGEAIAADVRDLLRDHVWSYEQLEILLALHAQPDHIWDVQAIAAQLNISLDAASEALEHLCRSNLASGHGQPRVFTYDPSSAARRATVDRLARTHDEQRVEIIKLMSANAMDRLRTAAMRAFAEAFVLRRKQKDG